MRNRLSKDIALGGMLSANWNPIKAFDNVLNGGIISAVSDTAGIFIFLVVLGIIVALLNNIPRLQNSLFIYNINL